MTETAGAANNGTAPDAHLTGDAAAIDAAAAPAPAPLAAIAAPIDWHREARDFWEIIALLSQRFPRLGPVFSDANLDRLAGGWAPVLKRHNLHAGILGIYFAAGFATLPIAVEGYQAVKLDRADERAADAAAAPDLNRLHTRA